MQNPVELEIRRKLLEAFQPVHLEVTNESSMHSVPPGSETHFKVLIVSESFEAKSRVVRSREVHDILRHELSSGVHALTQRALTPAEWEKQGAANFVSPNCHGASKSDKG